MSDFFKKAIGLFVEYEETPQQPAPGTTTAPGNPQPSQSVQQPASRPTYSGPMSQQDIEKFTKHFAEVFDKANIEGLDYYEFSKMMDMLEATIPDENTRIVSVFATLKIQGLTKDRILETARHYVTVLETDKAQFEHAAAEKANSEIEDRKAKVAGLEKKISDNNEMIKKLTQEMADAQSMIGSYKNEIVQYDSKISANKGSYSVAYKAMYNKIISDIQKLTEII